MLYVSKNISFSFSFIIKNFILFLKEINMNTYIH